RRSRDRTFQCCPISRPLNRIRPLVGLIRPSTHRPTVVFPEPDSPTIESVSPRRRENETPLTAWTTARAPGIGKYFTKFCTSISGFMGDRVPPENGSGGGERELSPAAPGGLANIFPGGGGNDPQTDKRGLVSHSSGVVLLRLTTA